MDGNNIPKNNKSGDKRYFQRVEELSADPIAVAAGSVEFGVPGQGDGSDVGRRDFMKLVGTTFAAASVTAGCARRPVEKVIPYVYKPEEITPGASTWYATVCGACPAGCGLLVKSRDGRPIKIEGNPQHPLNQGGVCALGQGSVIDLYDGDRLRKPQVGGKESDWKAFMSAAAKALVDYESDGKGLALVTGPVSGPATLAAVDAFIAKYPGARHVVFEAAGNGAIVDAHSATHGTAAIPTYDFEGAKVVVSFGADFLGSWLAPAPFARAWSENRKLSANNKQLSTVVQIETRMSTTGASADHRVRILPSEQRGLVLALAAKLGAKVPSHNTTYGKLVDALAAKLKAAKGTSLVVADSADVAVQAAVNVINDTLGNYGKTLNIVGSFGGRRASDAATAKLLADAKSGAVTGLVLAEVNPVYASAQGADWKAALGKAKVSIALTQRLDETAKACKLQAATSHFLESWGDSEVTSGQLGMRQPLVRELFYTRQWEAVVLGLAGETAPYRDWMKKTYEAAVLPRATAAAGSIDALWDKAVHDGIYQLAPGRPGEVEVDQPNPAHAAWKTAAAAVAAKKVSLEALTGRKNRKARAALEAEITADEGKLGAEPGQTVKVKKKQLVQPELPKLNADGAAKALATAAAKPGSGKYELVTYVKAGHPAEGTNNPFIQELPGAISRVSWDNYACISPKTGKELGLGDGDHVALKSGATTLDLAVVLSPGIHDGAVAVALGYGRTDVGAVGNGIGKNAWPIAAAGAKADISKAGDKEQLAFLQRHHSAEHRDIIRETTITEWAKDPRAGNPTLLKALQRKSDDKSVPATPVEGRSVWGESWDYSKDYKWHMVVDLNACTGCGACVVACSLENNVPMVGKTEVATYRDMHWMRIDRYYAEKAENTPKAGGYDWDPTEPDLLALAENPEVVFQPVMCQHCEHAGCETVCPVIATMHTSEGLNAMAYNRCIGTRYCANNCAYKVRRFNWFNYPEDTEMWGKQDPEMVRLALNPDIVKRSRGVMEKCSMCVQRIQQGKSDTIRMGLDTIPDGLVQTACAQTCPSQAISFGNVNDTKSVVRKDWDDPRRYRLVEEIGTRPAIGYLTKVRNPLNVAANTKNAAAPAKAAPAKTDKKEG